MAHVEALLLLRRLHPASCPVAEVAEAAQLATLPAARRCLEELAAGGLVAPDGHEAYRYAPAGDTDAVDALAQMYNERPVTLVRAIYNRLAPVEAFADAFRLRRDEER
jgi:DNA-binding IclR family transcriptional regulator